MSCGSNLMPYNSAFKSSLLSIFYKNNYSNLIHEKVLTPNYALNYKMKRVSCKGAYKSVIFINTVITPNNLLNQHVRAAWTSGD